jgi:hypothetical protein
MNMDYFVLKIQICMFRYRLETEINKPVEEVIRLFADRSHIPKWQPGLLSSDLI